jgi:hypothetical protein
MSSQLSNSSWPDLVVRLAAAWLLIVTVIVLGAVPH